MNSQFNQAIEAFQSGNFDRARILAESEISGTESPEAHHLLGLVHCRLGDPASGIEHLRLAAKAEPANAGYILMLMRALVDAGRATDVLEMPKPPPIRSAAALELWRARGEAADDAEDLDASQDAWSAITAAAPRDWKAWANLGNALAAKERWEEAGEALSKAASINPDELAIQRNAGSASLQAGKFEQAVGYFSALARARPEDAETRILLAHAFAESERHDEAIAEFETARRLGGPSLATELGIGRSLVAKLRFAEAEPVLKRAYEIAPADSLVVRQYGVVLERNNRLDALANLLDAAIEAGIGADKLSYLSAVIARRQGRLDDAHNLLLQSDPEDNPVGWHRLRARIADALGNVTEAFEAATIMNQKGLEQAMRTMSAEEWQQNAASYREEQHQLARAITPEWASRIPLLSEPSPRRIAFLVGFPRSGTTLLDTFLMGHPDIAVLEEEQLVGKASLGVKVKDLPGTSIDFVREARATYLRGVSEHVARDFGGLVLDKFPLDMAAAPLIQAMFPGAPIIFAQRHPCDVVLSGFMQSFGVVNFANIRDTADYYDAMMSTWTASRDAMKLNTRTVVYEELIEDPEEVLRPVIGFLGLEWDERVLDHQQTARERGTIATPSYDQVTEPISKSARGRWKRYRKQMEPGLPILLDWAERLGYRD
ncbi:MAG TPA: sulfotransferase [Sphingomicrobium sp.]|jgi:Flp pilus assembly protein TadD|nr:sulfotransferase [Sphingomicrobium sp.]